MSERWSEERWLWAEGRLLHLANLLPKSTIRRHSEWASDAGEEYDVVAIALVESTDTHSDTPIYSYVYLDADAREVGDWGPFLDLGDALAMLAREDDVSDVDWKELDSSDGDTLRVLREQWGSQHSEWPRRADADR